MRRSEQLAKIEAAIQFFFDDGALGSGSWDMPDGDNDLTNGFDQHLDALGIVFKHAAVINLRFKLSKCHFLQFAVPVLGEVAGLGKSAPRPK